MRSVLSSLFAALAVSPLLAACAPRPSQSYERGSHCPPFSGNFSIHAYQLYPENGDFDFNACVLYIGYDPRPNTLRPILISIRILWNASVGVYDPYKKKLEVVEFPGITHNREFHIGGVAINPNTNLLSVVVDAGAAFDTWGQDISGTNYIMQWNPSTRKLTYKHNLTTITQGRWGGPQDIEFDPDDNVYVVGTFPSSIMRVDSKGKKVETWYLDDNLNHTIAGYGGLASNGWTLITNDHDTGDLFRFDMRAKKGTPTKIRVKPEHKIQNTDAIQLPRRYKGTVLLVAENGIGMSVYRDKKGEWKEAEFLGIVPWADAAAPATAPLQIGDGVYLNIIQFGDAGLGGPGTAGNRTDFPYVDITAQVDALLKKKN